MDGSSPVRLPETAVLRPTSGKVLTVVIGLFAAIGLFSFVFRGEWREALGFTPLAVVVVDLCWLLFWFPSVTVEPSGVTFRNVLRTFRVSWPAIADVGTRYALTLFLRDGRKVVAWSAPSPSRYAGINTVRPDLAGLGRPVGDRGPVDASLDVTSVPLGDVPSSESGIAAIHVRRAWIALRDAGYLDSGALEGWNTRPLLILGALVVLGVLAAVLIR